MSNDGERTDLNEDGFQSLLFGVCHSCLNSMGLIKLCFKYCSFKNAVPQCEAEQYAKLNGSVEIDHTITLSENINVLPNEQVT